MNSTHPKIIGVFNELLASNSQMGAVLSQAVLVEAEKAITEGPNAVTGGPVDQGDRFACAQAAKTALENAADPGVTVLRLLEGGPGPLSFMPWFVVTAIKEYGDAGSPIVPPEGVHAQGWRDAASRAGAAMAMCGLSEGDYGQLAPPM